MEARTRITSNELAKQACNTCNERVARRAHLGAKWRGEDGAQERVHEPEVPRLERVWDGFRLLERDGRKGHVPCVEDFERGRNPVST